MTRRTSRPAYAPRIHIGLVLLITTALSIAIWALTLRAALSVIP
jgi:hypothetical protein